MFQKFRWRETNLIGSDSDSVSQVGTKGKESKSHQRHSPGESLRTNQLECAGPRSIHQKLEFTNRQTDSLGNLLSNSVQSAKSILVFLLPSQFIGWGETSVPFLDSQPVAASGLANSRNEGAREETREGVPRLSRQLSLQHTGLAAGWKPSLIKFANLQDKDWIDAVRYRSRPINRFVFKFERGNWQ